MNFLEKTIYGDSKYWFLLLHIEYIAERKQVTITVAPNNDVEEKSSFIFNNVTYFNIDYDDEQEPDSFPQQIMGIDYLADKKRIVIGCDEAEYVFEGEPYPTKG